MGHILEGKGPGESNVLHSSYSSLATKGSYIYHLVLCVPQKKRYKNNKGFIIVSILLLEKDKTQNLTWTMDLNNF